MRMHFGFASAIFLAIVFETDYVRARYDKGPLVDMKDYKDNFRTLDCWECFEARGKMCHDKDYSSMMRVTGSSNKGHGVCCKTDYEGKHCNNDGEHVCSAPSYDDNKKSEFKDVLSKGNLNQ